MKNLLLLVIFIFSLFIAACSDDTTSPNGGSETVLLSQDSLILYSDTVLQGDTISNYTEVSSAILNNPSLSGDKTCKITFTSTTNDSTNTIDTTSIVSYRVSTYTGVFPNQQFTTQLIDSLKGDLINTFQQNSVSVSISQSFGFRFYINASFRNRYHKHKYIKIYNIKVTHN